MAKTFKVAQPQASQPGPTNFDLFRLTASKREVNISPNTLRSYHAQGLPFYRQGKAVFISKTDLAHFIRNER